MTAEREPFLVPGGWSESVQIRNPGGPNYRVLFYPDGSARFEHRCDRGDQFATVICAPALQLDGGHAIITREPLTVTPSILCPDCGTHGFIQNGRWLPA